MLKTEGTIRSDVMWISSSQTTGWSNAAVRLAITTGFLAMTSSMASAAVSFIGTNVGGGGNGIAVADVNGDGKLDIIEANTGVTVLLGNGDGTFQAARQFAAGPSASSVVVADFNGDGKPDVAVSDASTSSVYILLGNGDGTFQPARQFATGQGVNPISIVAADFDGDGKLDVAVGDQGCVSSCGSYTITILLGNGDGTLQPPQHVNIPGLPYGLAAADFNHDGKQDLAVTAGAGLVVILLGKGDGTFQAPLTNTLTSGATGPGNVAVADFNRDGIPDLAVATGEGQAVAILLGHGDGTFAAPMNYFDSLDDVPNFVAVGDFSGDGFLDIAIAETGCCPSTVDGAVSVIQGNGDGTFRSYQRFIVPGFAIPNAAEYIAIGDFNKDGKVDMAMIMGGTIGGTVYMKNTTGTSPASFSLGALALTPSTVAGGSNSTANVMAAANAVAPSGSKTINLSSSNTNAATVPSTATMLSGMNNVLVRVLTNSGVTSTTTSTITASANNSVNAVLTVTKGSPPTIQTFTVSPTSITSGFGANGTITLSGPAPSTDATINLSSSNPSAASVPATATVPAGQTQTFFSIYSGSVSTSTTVTLTASYGTSSQTATLTVNPASSVAVSTLTLNPTTVAGGASSTATVTLKAPAGSGGQAVNIGSSSTVAIPSVAALTIPAGQSSGTFTVNTSSPSTTTTATISASAGGATANAALTINPAAITLSSLTISPNNVAGGSSSQGTVTLSSAPSGNAVVMLVSSNSSVATVPASVTVPAGATSALFTIATSSVTLTQNVTISATYSTTLNAMLTVSAPMGVTLSSLTLEPTSVSGGSSSTGTVTLSAAPTSATTIALSSSKTSTATVPSNVTVAAGSTSATFTISTQRVSSNTNVTITASLAGASKTAVLTVTRR
jgi:FG-GAP-like repeat